MRMPYVVFASLPIMYFLEYTAEVCYNDTLGNGQKSVTVSEWLILCHCKHLNFTIRLEIGKSEKCHCNQMALYCVTVTSVTVSNSSCIE